MGAGRGSAMLWGASSSCGTFSICEESLRAEASIITRWPIARAMSSRWVGGGGGLHRWVPTLRTTLCSRNAVCPPLPHRSFQCGGTTSTDQCAACRSIYTGTWVLHMVLECAQAVDVSFLVSLGAYPLLFSGVPDSSSVFRCPRYLHFEVEDLSTRASTSARL